MSCLELGTGSLLLGTWTGSLISPLTADHSPGKCLWPEETSLLLLIALLWLISFLILVKSCVFFFFFCVWLISHKVSSVGNSGPHFRIREFSFHSKSAGDPELWNQGPLFFDLAKSGVSPEGQRHWVSQTTIFLSPAHGRSSRFWTIKRYNSASSLGLIFAQSLEFASSQQDPCMNSYPCLTMDTFGNLHDAWPCRQGCRRVISVGWIFRLANTSRDLVFPVHL